MKWLQVCTLVVSLLLMSGCSSSTKDKVQELTKVTKGTIEASYLQGVKVCAQNICAVTDENGHFELKGVSAPFNAKIYIDDMLLKELNIRANNEKITPKVLAEGNETLASYIGAFLHKVANCSLDAKQCDLSNVQSIDIDENSNDALVEELKRAVANKSVQFTLNGEDNNLTLLEALSYANDNPTMLSNKVKFKGALNGGDYATFSFDKESKHLSYSVKGKLFPNGKEGSVALTPLANTKSFYKDANDNFYFITKSLGIANVEIANGVSGFVVGLQSPLESIDVAQIINKRYYTFYIKEDPTVGVVAQLSMVELNASAANATVGTWRRFDNDEIEEHGTWELDGSKLKIKDENNNTVAYAILRAAGAHARVGFVMDFVDGGIALGVEAKAITPEQISGHYEIYNYEDYDNGHQTCIGNVDVNGNSFRYVMSQCSGEDTEDVGEPYVGTLILNPTIDGITYNGLIKVNNDEDEFILMDNEAGYFISVITGENNRLDSITIGSNKALQ